MSKQTKETTQTNEHPTGTQANWYVNLVTAINSKAEELGLDDLGTQNLRDFVMEKARAQFMAGNKSGIRWMRGQLNAKEPAQA